MPLAVCEFILEARTQQGWDGTIAPARCPACQRWLSVGDAVILRGGKGVSHDGDIHGLPVGSQVTVAEVATWEGEGSIFLVRLPSGTDVFVTRAQISSILAGWK